ncbi:MAG: LCP family protein, partial [Angelakisella sp.]
MKKRRFLRVGLIMLFLAGITLAVSVSYYNAKLNLLNYDYSGSMTTDTPVPVANGTLGIPLQLDAVIKLQTSTEQVSGGDIYTEADVLNILLIGTDERKEKFDENARADSIMLFSLHLKNHTVKLVSLERGIGVPIEGRNDDWLTHVFRYGGAELLLQTVRDCFKVDVDRYVRVNFYAFKTIIDSVGGVDIVLTKEEVKALNEEVYTNAATDVRVVEGLNHLSGHDTLQYCR